MEMLVVYSIVTFAFSFAMILAMIGGEGDVGTVAMFFDPVYLKGEMKWYGIIVTLFFGYVLMAPLGVVYWIVKIIKSIIKIAKR
jgi:hypothetical protein